MKNKIKWILPLASMAIVGASFAPIISCAKPDPGPTPDPGIPKSIELTYGTGQKSNIEIEYNETLTFNCVVYPSTAPQDFVLTSSRPSIASFDGNELKPKQDYLQGGTTIISAKCKDYPGITSNVIEVTVKPRQSSLSIDYSNVDFNQTMIVGSNISTYKFTGFDADFDYDPDGEIVGGHQINAYANWVEGTTLNPITVTIQDLTKVGTHTKFNIDVSCAFTEWEKDVEYKYSLFFVIDEGQETEKQIDVDEDLCFVNHIEKPTITEPVETTVIPKDHGGTIVIEGFGANFQIGPEYQKELSVDVWFDSGYVNVMNEEIINVHNTASSSTFDVLIETFGLDLSEDVIFHMDFILNEITIKESQDYTIEASDFISCNEDYSFTIKDRGDPSVTIDGFSANFEFDNEPSSSYPIVTASGQSYFDDFADPTITITNVTKYEGYTSFSINIVFEPIPEPWMEKPFTICFDKDGDELVSDRLIFFFSTAGELHYLGDDSPKPILNGKYEDEYYEECEGWFTNIGAFVSYGEAYYSDFDVRFEWNSKNELPTPVKILTNIFSFEFSNENLNYLTIVWPDEFDPGSSTFKLTIYDEDGGDPLLVMDDLSLTTSRSDHYWDISSTFEGSSGKCTVTKNEMSEIDATLSDYDTTKELWGVKFNCGGVETPVQNSVDINAQNNGIIIKPNFETCNLPPGLKLQLTFVYVNPNDIIHIDQSSEQETYRGKQVCYSSDDINWEANKTYYLSADLSKSGFGFEIPWAAILGGFIGDVKEIGAWKQIDYIDAYNNKALTDASCLPDELPGAAGIALSSDLDGSLEDAVVNFSITVSKNLGKHKFTLIKLV